jgi:hypothetical protein
MIETKHFRFAMTRARVAHPVVRWNMERNPYTPPSTPIADIAGDSVTINREVLTACKLLWVSLACRLLAAPATF